MSTSSAHPWGEGPHKQWEEGDQGSPHLQGPGGESRGDPPGPEQLLHALLAASDLNSGFQQQVIIDDRWSSSNQQEVHTGCTGISHQRVLGSWELTSVQVHVTAVVV